MYRFDMFQHNYVFMSCFYLLCIFNMNRAPWKSSIAILKGLPCIKKTEIKNKNKFISKANMHTNEVL